MVGQGAASADALKVSCQQNQTIMKMLKTYLMPAVLAVAAFTLTGCTGRPGPEYARKVAQDMQETLPAEFARSEFTVPPQGTDLAPSLVYEGKNSTILATRKPYIKELPFGPEVVIDGLARTKNGRDFWFRYNSKMIFRSNTAWFLDEWCTKELDCRYFSDRAPYTEAEAKSWFFNSAEFTPERYKAIFNETAPAKRIPA
ncbi:hypothetical protein D7S81_25135 [Ralstonia insidiosa]|nr:hypothetical protein [Ralstonia insidiosa]